MDVEYSDDDCCICCEVMWDPAITPCKHYICFTCLENILCYKRLCPLCRAYIPTSFTPVIDKPKQKEIKARHKEAMAKNMKDLKIQKIFCDNLTLSYGNYHKIIDAAGSRNTHAWAAFVRLADNKLDISKFVTKVVFVLHPTFSNPVVEVTEAPFRITRVGWGTFPVRIEVHWQSWLQKSPTKLEHDLSFRESGAWQSQVIKFEKSIFEDEDQNGEEVEEEKKQEEMQVQVQPVQVPALRGFKFSYGNTHEIVESEDSNRHTWTAFVESVYVSVDISKFVQKVQFMLHPTFKNPVREVTSAPFEITLRGWGTFEIEIVIYWEPSLGKAPMRLKHYLSFEGNGASRAKTLKL